MALEHSQFDIWDLANGAGGDKVANGEKARKRAPVVADPERNARRATGGDHVETFGVIHSHRLFYIYGLARCRAAQRVFAMRVGKRRDVDSVDVIRANDRIGVVVPAHNAMSARVVFWECAVAPHA